MKRRLKYSISKGQRFGRLTVVSFPAYCTSGSYVDCLCDCGNKKSTLFWLLLNGRCQSCGCQKRDNCRRVFRTHGQYGTPTYGIWAAMITRCTNPNARYYERYGGRGIKVCERWLKFENFLADMGVRPEGLTLERKNNDDNYSPENCIWATLAQQANNRSNNHFIEIRGERLTLSQWARRFGLKANMVNYRVVRLGWTVEEALNLVPRRPVSDSV